MAQYPVISKTDCWSNTIIGTSVGGAVLFGWNWQVDSSEPSLDGMVLLQPLVFLPITEFSVSMCLSFHVILPEWVEVLMRVANI